MYGLQTTLTAGVSTICIMSALSLADNPQNTCRYVPTGKHGPANCVSQMPGSGVNMSKPNGMLETPRNIFYRQVNE